MQVVEKIKKKLATETYRVLGTAKDLKIRWLIPPNPEWGDLALPFFEIAKSLEIDGAQVREKLKNFKLPQGVDKYEIKGEYINFYINPSFIAQTVCPDINKNFGKNQLGEKKRLMLEFSQPNTHKEFHIGHVRNAVLGQSIVNILKASGYKVIAANYLGDVGAHVAKWIWCYKKWHDGEEPAQDRAKFLSRIYQEATEKIEQDEAYKNEVAQIQNNLEQGDKDLVKIWKKSRKWSLQEFNRIYKTLNVKFDVDFFESEEEKSGKEIVKNLLDKGIAKISQGAIIMDLNKYGLDVFLLLKSDGAALYATKDLSLAFKKFKKYKLDESWYLVDSRQAFYFKQLFKTMELAGLKQPLRHLIYEFVSLPEGVISSRAGRMVGFNDLLQKVKGLAREETQKRHEDWGDNQIHETSQAIAMAAIKFDMLKQSREKKIVFDPKKALSFEGYTGPYLLYTIARINSILRKAGRAARISNYSQVKIEPLEKELLMKLAQFPQIVENAARDGEPAVISQYLFELAKKLSEFYHELPVLKADEPEKLWRINLISHTKQVLENGLSLLNIDFVEKM